MKRLIQTAAVVAIIVSLAVPVTASAEGLQDSAPSVNRLTELVAWLFDHLLPPATISSTSAPTGPYSDPDGRQESDDGAQDDGGAHTDSGPYSDPDG